MYITPHFNPWAPLAGILTGIGQAADFFFREWNIEDQTIGTLRMSDDESRVKPTNQLFQGCHTLLKT